MTVSNDDLQELTQRLDDVEGAMERIDQGTYGRCSSCAQELSSASLEVNPTLSVCVNCAQARNNG